METPTQEYRDITEVALKNELATAQQIFGPGQLATIITLSITDTEYLKEVLTQVTNNLNGR